MIKRIELINFMSHAHTVIEPSAGLTVLIGPNNCGKSAVVSALQTLCHNQRGDFMLRHGESRCDVIVETVDHHRIQWTRKKTGGGTYLIDGETFDRLKGKTPDRLHEILKMPRVECGPDELDVHFGEQLDPVFLLRDSGRAAAQFFASSSDATHLIRMQGRHKENVTLAKSEVKRLSAREQQLESELACLAPAADLEKRCQRAEAQELELQKSAAFLKELEAVVLRFASLESKTEAAAQRTSCLQSLSDPPLLTDIGPLAQLLTRLLETRRHRGRSAQFARPLADLAEPPVMQPTENLQRSVVRQLICRQRMEHLQATVSHLAPLPPPPEMQPVDTLAALISSLQRVGQRSRSSQQVLSSLTTLSPPPEPQPVAGLVHTIGRLRIQLDRMVMLKHRFRAADTVAPPPSLESTESLESFIGKIRQLEVRVEQCRVDDERAGQQLADAAADIQDWVEDNPTCPTCGGNTSVQHILDHVERTGA